jgi:hypothetical protein
MVDYDPDFLREAAREASDRDLADVADRSYALVRQAVAPSGLLYDIVQPEVLTLTPLLRQPVFSPNDVVQLSNASSVAERAAGGAPEVGRGVLAFAMARRKTPRAYYLGRTGEAVGVPERDPGPPGAETYAALVRLALRLGDKPAAAAFQRRLLECAWRFSRRPAEPRLYTAGEILLALEMLGRENAPHE